MGHIPPGQREGRPGLDEGNPDLDEEEDLPAELAELQDKRAHDVLLALKIKRVT